MLDNVLDTTDAAAGAFAGTAAEWAQPAAGNLAACGVLREGEAFSEELDRAGAAEILCRAIELLESRGD